MAIYSKYLAVWTAQEFWSMFGHISAFDSVSIVKRSRTADNIMITVWEKISIQILEIP